MRLLTSPIFLLPCLILLHIILLINTRFTLWPEMVVYPYLINNGFALYSDLINPYPPAMLIFLAYFSKIFAYSIVSYQLLAWMVILALDISIFYIANRISKDKRLVLVASTFFIILSLPFGANQLWFDLVQTLPIIFSAYYFYKFSQAGRARDLDISFLLVAVAITVKQQAIWLLLAYIAIIITRYSGEAKNLISKIKLTYTFLLIVAVIHLAFIVHATNLRDFFDWVIYFPLLKASSAPGYLLPPTARQMLITTSVILLFLPTILKGKTEAKLPFIASTSLLLFAYPRFDYFHLIPFIAVASIYAGENFRLFLKIGVPAKAVVLITVIAISIFTLRFLSKNWTTEVRFFENEVLATAGLISILTGAQDKIYIQNGPDQLLPLALRLPPKPWIDEFPWYLENNAYQQRVTESLKKEKVSFIVYKEYLYNGQYELGSYIPNEIASYTGYNYEKYVQLRDGLWLNKRKSFN